MVSAVIVAAGRGTRMGPNVDKLFLEVAGLPIVAHAWRRFDQAPEIDEIILVIRPGMESAFKDIATQVTPTRPFRFTHGGAERQDSVANGLNAVSPAAEFVMIHDGARPCPHPSVLANCLAAARAHGAAVAAQKVTDTIKQTDGAGFIERNVDRERLASVQTPQVFRLPIIRRALEEVRARGLAVTDDTAACELIGQKVALVFSPHPNPKATSPSDLPYIDVLLRRETVPAQPCNPAGVNLTLPKI